jgi:dolichol-phosphate mannosyltransferase
MGVVFFVLGILFGIVTIVNKVANPEVPIGYSSLATIVSLGFGVTNIALGIIAEYLWRTYDAARKRPVFLVSEVLTIKENIDV